MRKLLARLSVAAVVIGLLFVGAAPAEAGPPDVGRLLCQLSGNLDCH